MATPCLSFEILSRVDGGIARTAVLRLPHGEVRTPAFMPVGTAGTVKGLSPLELRESGVSLVLCNTFHLWLRPGPALVEKLGGIQKFMGWNGPVLTDSGGFQVFSLRELRSLSEEGVRFRSPIEGDWRMLTPEIAVEIQETLGVDIAMALDECISYPTDRDAVARSTDRTTRWLERCLRARRHPDRTALFGIVQGGFYEDLRAAHAELLRGMDLDGYAIGGVSVGEPRDEMMAAVALTAPLLPEDRPRYLMGVGYPLDIVESVMQGVDLFDCVLPTRSGRFGQAFTSEGRLTIKHARYREDSLALDPACSCYTCRSFSRAYLRHLFIGREMLGPRLVSLHNVAFYQALMERIRQAIQGGPNALSVLREQAALWTSQIPA